MAIIKTNQTPLLLKMNQSIVGVEDVFDINWLKRTKTVLLSASMLSPGLQYCLLYLVASGTDRIVLP